MSFVLLARGLAELGHQVSVFGGVTETADRGVQYRPRNEFDPNAGWAMVIGARLPTLFGGVPESPVRVLWAHDYHYRAELTESLAARMDVVVVSSNYHRTRITDAYPFVADKVRIIPLGVDRTNFSDLTRPRRTRLVYTSAPERGLEVVLDMWPEIRARVPQAELAYCYPSVYDDWREKYPKFREMHERLSLLARQDGVEYLGSLGHKALADVLCESRVWVLPSWSPLRNNVVPETFCLSAAQAQVAGCWPVASSVGALPETVRVGKVVDAQAGSAEWRSDLLDAIVAGLSEDELSSRAIAAAAVAGEVFDSRATAARFAALMQAARS
jgi:glycosyltransferase involved in cell wall biosynthesis